MYCISSTHCKQQVKDFRYIEGEAMRFLAKSQHLGMKNVVNYYAYLSQQISKSPRKCFNVPQYNVEWEWEKVHVIYQLAPTLKRIFLKEELQKGILELEIHSRHNKRTERRKQTPYIKKKSTNNYLVVHNGTIW